MHFVIFPSICFLVFYARIRQLQNQLILSILISSIFEGSNENVEASTDENAIQSDTDSVVKYEHYHQSIVSTAVDVHALDPVASEADEKVSQNIICRNTLL